MKRILTPVILFLLGISPISVYALGLGNIDLNSALNEPFDARIELLSATAEELESLNVGLAGAGAFQRAGIDRPFILSKLKFSVRESEDAPDYIRVHSADPIREPFLNFLLEVNWSKGRLFREYTVLLDPPLYDPSRKMQASLQPVVPISAVSESEVAGHKVVYEAEFTQYGTSPVISYAGGDYGPTSSTDTLWSIAKGMRPDASVNVNQMMLALLRANPDAFLNNNINGLKRGQILRMPDSSEIYALSGSEALAEVKSQYAMWDEVRNTLSAAVSERPGVPIPAEPIATEMTPAGEAIQEEGVSDAELRLVTPTGEGEGSDQVASDEMGAGAGAAASAEELVLAKESVEALTQENQELKDRLQETEVLIDDLKRLIALKDDELASLQDRLAQSQVMVEEAVEETPAAVEEIEEVTPDVEVAEEEIIEEEEEILPADDEMEVEEEAAEEVVDEAVVDEEMVAQPGTPSGVMGIVGQYLGPVTDIVAGNKMIAMAGGGILIVLILLTVLMRFRKSAVPEAGGLTTEFPDFSEGEITGPAMLEPEAEIESEAVTVLPESEAETEQAVAEAAAEEDEVDRTQFISEVPAVEEPEEDPLQEVNTYLAFEQFDQAEEFVRKALEGDPDNPEFHVKLLEVFYTSGDKKSYEEAAQVLHDKVGGDGEHWSMAVAMWQEMSPNRALFETPAEGEEEEKADTAGGGIVDITADEEAPDDAGLDFDLGAGGAEETPAAEGEEDILDVTAAVDTDSADAEDLLDVTAAVGLDEVETDGLSSASEDEQMFDITAGDEEELLDITAGAEEELLDITAGAEDELLDITAGAEEELLDITAGAEEELLDITAAVEEEESASIGDSGEGLLDISQDAGGDDLLDVTVAVNLEPDSAEDLLDLTAATSAGADIDELLEIDTRTEESTATEDENAVDFDIGGLEMESDQAESDDTGGDNVIEFDTAVSSKGESEEGEGLDLNLDAETDSDADKGGIELDLSGLSDDSGDELSLDIEVAGGEEAEDEGLMLDMENADEEGADSEETQEITFDVDVGESEVSEIDLTLDEETGSESAEDDGLEETQGISLDMGDEESETPEIDLTLDEETESEPAVEEASEEEAMDFDLSFDIEEETGGDGEEINVDETVEIPKIELDMDDEDDDEDHTVFVPRSTQPEEQTAEDEIATKLDLAKAYVELGDKDSAKTILDEVMAEGNDDQRQQAQELLNQI